MFGYDLTQYQISHA